MFVRPACTRLCSVSSCACIHSPRRSLKLPFLEGLAEDRLNLLATASRLVHYKAGACRHLAWHVCRIHALVAALNGGGGAPFAQPRATAGVRPARPLRMLTNLPHSVGFCLPACLPHPPSPGETVFREGDEGSSFYIVVHGELEVSIASDAAALAAAPAVAPVVAGGAVDLDAVLSAVEECGLAALGGAGGGGGDDRVVLNRLTVGSYFVSVPLACRPACCLLIEGCSHLVSQGAGARFCKCHGVCCKIERLEHACVHELECVLNLVSYVGACVHVAVVALTCVITCAHNTCACFRRLSCTCFGVCRAKSRC